MLKISLDSNLFYDLAQGRQRAPDVEAILDFAREGKALLFSTPTTDFEDESGTATSIILKLISQGVVQEAPNAGTPREFMPGGPGLHTIEEEECDSLLRDIWPNDQWKSASENKRNDVFHLLAHKRNGHEHFLTNDNEILRKRKILKNKYDVIVMSPKEFLAMLP